MQNIICFHSSTFEGYFLFFYEDMQSGYHVVMTGYPLFGMHSLIVTIVIQFYAKPMRSISILICAFISAFSASFRAFSAFNAVISSCITYTEEIGPPL